MKTKKFFTEVQNFWAPKIQRIFAESEDFCLLMSEMKISEHYQKSEVMRISEDSEEI